jgi:hypothetical protein
VIRSGVAIPRADPSQNTANPSSVHLLLFPLTKIGN